MHASYDDIMSRIATPPIWFDENAVPRYCDFNPERSASIHIGEIALVEVTCQACGKPFLVALSSVNFGQSSVSLAIRSRTLHYGDPPRHGAGHAGSCVGNTMNSEPRRVREYWHRHDRRYLAGSRITDLAYFDWARDSSFEVDIVPEWVKHVR